MLPHLDAAYTLARYLVRDKEDAQDIVQDSFLRALRHYDGYRGENARAWLLAIVRNCCATWRGKARALQEHVEFDEQAHSEHQSESPAELSLLRAATVDAFHRALDALTIDARSVIVLRDVEELSYEEIALVLEIPIGTVMSRLNRARKRLQDILREELRDAG